MAIALTIAGSDSGGGAGIQVDLAAFAAFGVYGTCAITAVTAQNTVGVKAVHPVPPAIVQAQIEAVLADFEVGAIKIGMVPGAAHSTAIAAGLAGWRGPIVLDPVMIATSGYRLVDPEAVATLRELLFPLAACITPNLPEAAALLNTVQATTPAEMIEQAKALLDLGPGAVLMKGGHSNLDQAMDILVTRDGVMRLASAWVETPNLHGTGCALSAAIAAALAQDHTLAESAAQAKTWLSAAITAGATRRVGHGNGPVLAPT